MFIDLERKKEGRGVRGERKRHQCEREMLQPAKPHQEGQILCLQTVFPSLWPVF